MLPRQTNSTEVITGVVLDAVSGLRFRSLPKVLSVILFMTRIIRGGRSRQYLLVSNPWRHYAAPMSLLRSHPVLARALLTLLLVWQLVMSAQAQAMPGQTSRDTHSGESAGVAVRAPAEHALHSVMDAPVHAVMNMDCPQHAGHEGHATTIADQPPHSFQADTTHAGDAGQHPCHGVCKCPCAGATALMPAPPQFTVQTLPAVVVTTVRGQVPVMTVVPLLRPPIR